MSVWVSIKGLDKADVLAALYNASKPQGMGFMHFDPKPMTREEAAELLREAAQRPYFDYVKGRVMKIDLSDSRLLDVRLYDRDNGDGAAERAIEGLWERLTRPDAEECACPMCAGTGKVAKKEAERWSDSRRAEAWRKEKCIPSAESEVDESRFQKMEVGPAQDAPLLDHFLPTFPNPEDPEVVQGADFGVGKARTFRMTLDQKQVVTDIAEMLADDEGTPYDDDEGTPYDDNEEVAPRTIETTSPTSVKTKAAVDEERFARLNERPAVLWGVYVGGRLYGGSEMQNTFASRKEALAAANKLRRFGLNVTVERAGALVDAERAAQLCETCSSRGVCGRNPPALNENGNPSCPAYEYAF